MWYAAKLLVRPPAAVYAVGGRRSMQVTFKRHVRACRENRGRCNEMHCRGAD